MIKAKKERILLICTNNSARSKMARIPQKCLYDVCNAGTESTVVNPYVIKVMSKIGIDISKHRSKSLKEFEDMEFDHVVTVCGADQACPFFLVVKNTFIKVLKILHVLKEMKKKMRVFREVRDEIISRIDKTFILNVITKQSK